MTGRADQWIRRTTTVSWIWFGWEGAAGSITEPIDLGPFEDAAPARVLFLRRHGLFGGVSGSGKSGLLNVLMANLSACTDVVIWAVDLKKGMELAPWASCIDRLATRPAEARALLRDAVAILEARAAKLARSGQRAAGLGAEPGHARADHPGLRARARHPTAARAGVMPWALLVVGSVASLAATSRWPSRR